MDETIEVKIKTNFAELIKRLEKKRGIDRISNNALARQLPMAYRQVKRFRTDSLTRIDLLTLQKALNFFNKQGLDVGPEDLFVWK